MRTKSMILAAAAVLGGFLSAQAQNVYSLNIVGYVNTVLKGGGNYTLIANPLDNGTNDINSTVGALLPNKSQVVTFDGVNYFTATKTNGVWTSNLNLPLGKGFFVKNGTASSPDLTNTFVGNVSPSAPGTNSVSIPIGYSLVGSQIPVGGTLTDAGPNTLNLGVVLANKSQVVTFDANTASYFTSTKTNGVWTSNLNLSVGQGFFIKAQTAGSNWVQILQ